MPLLFSVLLPEIFDREVPPTIRPPSFVSAMEAKKSKSLPPRSFYAVITGCAKVFAIKEHASSMLKNFLFIKHVFIISVLISRRARQKAEEILSSRAYNR